MEKRVLAAASFEKQKYFLDPAFQALPEAVQEEVRTICVILAQKLGAAFVMGFYEDGEVYVETVKREGDFDFDEIGADLEVKELYRQKRELFQTLKLWYRVFFTQEGKEIKNKLLDGEKSL